MTAVQRQTKRRTKVARVQRKCLDDDDIVRVLGAMQAALGGKEKQLLKRRINENIELVNKRKHERSQSAPHRKIDQLHRIQNAVVELRAALRAYDAERHFPFALDRVEGHPCSKTRASVEALQAEFPDTDVDVAHLLADLGAVVPSAEAKAGVARDVQGVRRLGALAGFAASRERRLQAAALGTNKKQVKQPDDWRYALVMNLADIYKKVFHCPPKATRGDAWYAFLAAVLTCCEGKQVSHDSAHSIWLKTRRWKEKQLQEWMNALEAADEGRFRSENNSPNVT